MDKIFCRAKQKRTIAHIYYYCSAPDMEAKISMHIIILIYACMIVCIVYYNCYANIAVHNYTVLHVTVFCYAAHSQTQFIHCKHNLSIIHLKEKGLLPYVQSGDHWIMMVMDNLAFHSFDSRYLFERYKSKSLNTTSELIRSKCGSRTMCKFSKF